MAYFVPDNPRLEGYYSTPGPQNILPRWVNRLLDTLMNRDALQYGDTSRSNITTAPLIPVQEFSRPANPNLPPDLAAMGVSTTRATTARNMAGRNQIQP